MSTIRFRSPVTKPLLPKGTPKPVPPDPRAYDTFRVTQQFEDPDAYWLLSHPGRPISEAPKHRAADVGNFRCGDPVVAMAPGAVRRVKDSAGALGVIVDHGSGITSESWHLNGYAGPASGMVPSGQQVGVVGRTGLGDVCHLHVEVKRNGVRIDPEPLMFGGSLTIEEEDMRFSGSELTTLPDAAKYTLEVGSNFRADRSTTSPILATFPAGTAIYPSVSIDGQAIGDNDQWAPCFMYTGKAYEWGYFHTSVIDPPVPAAAADCSAQESTIAQLKTKIARANTANNGAKQAQEAVSVALR